MPQLEPFFSWELETRESSREATNKTRKDTCSTRTTSCHPTAPPTPQKKTRIQLKVDERLRCGHQTEQALLAAAQPGGGAAPPREAAPPPPGTGFRPQPPAPHRPPLRSGPSANAHRAPSSASPAAHALSVTARG